MNLHPGNLQFFIRKLSFDQLADMLDIFDDCFCEYDSNYESLLTILLTEYHYYLKKNQEYGLRMFILKTSITSYCSLITYIDKCLDDKIEDGTEDETVDGTEDETVDRTKDETVDGTENKIEYETEDGTEDETEDETDDKTENVVTPYKIKITDILPDIFYRIIKNIDSTETFKTIASILYYKNKTITVIKLTKYFTNLGFPQLNWNFPQMHEKDKIKLNFYL